MLVQSGVLPYRFVHRTFIVTSIPRFVKPQIHKILGQSRIWSLKNPRIHEILWKQLASKFWFRTD